ncbi:MAG: hypothetical protein ACK4I8_09595 [Armatimonadota bacterium]
MRYCLEVTLYCVETFFRFSITALLPDFWEAKSGRYSVKSASEVEGRVSVRADFTRLG